MYYNGEGVAMNMQEAFKWYMKAAEQGLKEAQYSVGLMYANGEVTMFPEKKEARRWLRAAANQGDRDARLALKRL